MCVRAFRITGSYSQSYLRSLERMSENTGKGERKEEKEEKENTTLLSYLSSSHPPSPPVSPLFNSSYAFLSFLYSPILSASISSLIMYYFLSFHLTFVPFCPVPPDPFSSSIEPKTNEAVMLAMNAVNNCPYCTGLHGELARMACNPRGTSSTAEGEVILRFAKTFSENNGRGAAVEEGMSKLREVSGAGKASSVAALCWFLHWGSFG